MTALYPARLGGAKFTAADPVVPRDRRVDSRVVPCPDCGAEVGERCPDGKAHPVRRRMAVRLGNELNAYSAADVQYAQHGLTPAGRRHMRRAAGLTTAALARLLDVDYRHLITWEAGRCPASGPEGARYGAWLREQATS